MGENVEARRKFIEENALEVVTWISRRHVVLNKSMRK